MTNEERAKEIIEKMIHITIATCDENGQPWNTPVYAAYDEEYNFYWTSAKDNQHSENIRGNSKVFIVVYDSTGEIGDKTGVYVLAEARELEDPDEIAKARSYTQRRKGENPDGYENFVGDKLRRVYKATSKQFWINNAVFKGGDFLKDFRVEVKLK